MQESALLLAYLRAAWDQLVGSGASAMAADKLTRNRIEALTWSPPVLQFRIERHGPTAQGSTRAEVQSWTVDVDAGTAAATAVGRRQLRPMARQLDVRPLADHVANLIVRDVDDPGLRWSGNRRRVTVRIGEVIPDHGPKETVQGRRRRFREALETALAKERWTPDPSCFNTYRF